MAEIAVYNSEPGFRRWDVIDAEPPFDEAGLRRLREWFRQNYDHDPVLGLPGVIAGEKLMEEFPGLSGFDRLCFKSAIISARVKFNGRLIRDRLWKEKLRQERKGD